MTRSIYVTHIRCWLCHGTGKARVTPTDVLLGGELHGRTVDIIREVADAHGLTPADIISKSRVPRLVEARDDVIYRLRTELDMTLQGIGFELGGRDHSTISHSLKKSDAA